MRTNKGFRFRIYPTPAQVARIEAWEHALRFLWNLAHEQRLMCLAVAKDHRRYPTAFDQINELTALRAEKSWLADVPRGVSAQLLIELDKAWQRGFKRLARIPRWKKKGRDTVSLCEPGPGKWRLDENILRFPKLGSIRIVAHRTLEGTPKTCTIKRDGDQWFASIVCELDLPSPAPRTAPVVAIDRGLAVWGATSDGDLITNPRPLEAALKRLARAQRTVSRRKKGSKNREKAKLKVARIHRKVRRQREHHLHVLSRRLANSHGVVVLEKLNVAGMIKGRCARSIADAGWSKFARMIRYKLDRSGGALVEVPAAYSSQECSTCGCVDALSRRSQAVFVCTSCGYRDHADINAAKVLLGRAIRSALPVDGTACKGPGRSRKRLRVIKRASEIPTL